MSSPGTSGRRTLKLGAALPLAAIVALLVLTGCGGDERADTTSPGPQSRPSQSGRDSVSSFKATQAEAICRQANREMQAVGRRLPQVFSQSPSPQVAISNGLIRPGIEILSQEAAALRGLGARSNSKPVRLFVGLFDPIVALSRERLKPGGTPEHGHELELMIGRLGDEQAVAARKAGLEACSVNIIQALEN